MKYLVCVESTIDVNRFNVIRSGSIAYTFHVKDTAAMVSVVEIIIIVSTININSLRVCIHDKFVPTAGREIAKKKKRDWSKFQFTILLPISK